MPQAFSHWSYQYSRGDLLVCDLQGVLHSSFELTDPAIHSRYSRDKCFGPTDNGPRGHQAFFVSHRCNALCTFLKLTKPSFKPT